MFQYHLGSDHYHNVSATWYEAVQTCNKDNGYLTPPGTIISLDRLVLFFNFTNEIKVMYTICKERVSFAYLAHAVTFKWFNLCWDWKLIIEPWYQSLYVFCIVFRQSWIGVKYDANLSRYIWHNGMQVQSWPTNYLQTSGASDSCILFKPNGFINCAEERKYTCRKRPTTIAGKIGNYVAHIICTCQELQYKTSHLSGRFPLSNVTYTLPAHSAVCSD